MDADMSNGNPALGNRLGSRAITPPNGRALPVNYVVGGHSAGGHDDERVHGNARTPRRGP
ncbi:hypothetical protein [Streptosporangium sp. NPDC001681]|uniref:hypothetical protein n=1 Tax=Streptosporangium sp. NPDC001681 TaxID=3154395 RepID=UPI0033300644